MTNEIEEYGRMIEEQQAKEKSETPKRPIMPRPALADFDRVTGRFTIHHQRHDMEPRFIESTFHRYLKEREQPVQRDVTVGTNWMPIDLFWLDGKAGILVIENTTNGRMVLPSQEEQQEIDKRVLIVAYKGQSDGFIVRPGMPFVAEPQHHSALRMRSVEGEVKVTITAFPQ